MAKQIIAIKQYFKVNSKIFLFLTILFIIGIISGSIFYLTISDVDNNLVISFLQNYINGIKNDTFSFKESLISYLGSNVFLYGITWLLGFSIIGVPIILFLFFYKCFCLGFSITSILSLYKAKGIILAFIYVFPHHIIYVFLYMILIIYAFTISFNIIVAVIKKSEVSFKNITHKYFIIILICLAIIILFSLYESYLLPKIMKYILRFYN